MSSSSRRLGVRTSTGTSDRVCRRRETAPASRPGPGANSSARDVRPRSAPRGRRARGTAARTARCRRRRSGSMRRRRCGRPARPRGGGRRACDDGAAQPEDAGAFRRGLQRSHGPVDGQEPLGATRADEAPPRLRGRTPATRAPRAARGRPQARACPGRCSGCAWSCRRGAGRTSRRARSGRAGAAGRRCPRRPRPAAAAEDRDTRRARAGNGSSPCVARLRPALRARLALQGDPRSRKGRAGSPTRPQRGPSAASAPISVRRAGRCRSRRRCRRTARRSRSRPRPRPRRQAPGSTCPQPEARPPRPSGRRSS